MGSFDYSRAAGIISNSPNPILDVMGVEMGIPSCLLDMAKGILSMLPSGPLNTIKNKIQEGHSGGVTQFNELFAKIHTDLGMVQYDSNTGRFIWVTTPSANGVDATMLDSLNDLGALGTAMGFGAAAWQMGEAAINQWEEAMNCIDQLTTYESLQKGPSSNADKFNGFTTSSIDANGDVIEETFPPPPPILTANSQLYDSMKAELEYLTGFIARCESQLQAILEIIQCRQKTPDICPEPCLLGETILNDSDSPYDGSSIQELSASGLLGNLCVINPSDVYGPSPAGWQNIINISGTLPPESIEGQFLFSKTGIYYDSYGGGLDYSGCITNIVSAVYYDSSGNPLPGRGVPPNMMKWLHQYNPNIGGKGEVVSWNTFNVWANTVFDITNVLETPFIQNYYDEDHFLQVLIDQRNKEIYDVSSYIGQLTTQGYAEASLLLSNQRQVLYSKISTHNSKINRRKKQIEVHVMLSPEDSPAVLGNIPINEFKGLSKAKLAIEKAKQEQLLFNPGEVSGVVLPLCPTFIQETIPQDNFTVDELMVPEVGIGGIIYSDALVSGTSGTTLSLDNHLTTDGLVAIYNFLDSDLVTPDSQDYFSINCVTASSSDRPAQLVASSIESMFPSGIGIPYFRGICNFFSGADGNPKSSLYSTSNEYLYSAYRPYGYGRLKSGFAETDNLLYNTSGATFEYWLHVPDLGTANGLGWAADQSLSSLNRVVMGCENRGGTLSTQDDYWIVGPSEQDSVRGLLIGFSRDKRLTKELYPSNNPADNNLTEGLVFHMSPTQSVNTSGVTFISPSGNAVYFVDGTTPPSGFYGIKVDTSTTNAAGTSFNDCSTAFIHTAITVDYGINKVSIYLNGQLLKSQGIVETFGGIGPTPPNIPNMIDTSSFNYSGMYVDSLPEDAPLFPPGSLGQKDFWYWNGPQSQAQGMGVFTTPWIIGGGFTDGMHSQGSPTYTPGSIEGMNFMGGKWGGKKSGLHGFIGSLKLYNRGLTASEVLKNYKAQLGFFTNIRI